MINCSARITMTMSHAMRSVTLLLLCQLTSMTALAADGGLQILTTEEPPANYTVGGEVAGITTDVVNDLRARLAEKAAIEVLPWTRVYRTALTRPNTLIFTLGKTPERAEQGLVFIGPITTRKHVIYKRSESDLRVDSLDDIKRQGLLVGGMRGDWRTALIKEHGIRVDEAVTHQRSLKLLLMGSRIDLIAMSDIEWRMHAILEGLSHDRLKPAMVISEAPAYLAFSKGTPSATVAKWQHALSDFQASDVPSRLARKWGKIIDAPMGYTPEKGFFLTTSGEAK